MDRSQLEAMLLSSLPAIERMSALLARRAALTAEEAEEFLSFAKLKLIADDYAVLRKFRGESSLTTYLAVVLTMMMREFRVKAWGRWRPSAEARRRGEVAIRLEALVYRSGNTVKEAVEILRSSGATALSDTELGRLLSELPRRGPLRPVQVGEEALSTAVGGERADAGLLDELRTQEQEGARAALGSVLARLSPEDQLIIRMRFWEGMSVADTARALGRDQRQLYRHFENLLSTLRSHLEAAGLLSEQARSVLAELAE